MKNPREFKGNSLLEDVNDYVVIDLETTGLDPKWDDIIEVGAVKVLNGEIIDKFQSLVNPGYPIDPFISSLTGITNEMLSSAPDIEKVLPEFLSFLGGSIVVGHNVNFDINFLYDSCVNIMGTPISNDFVDTMRLSRRIFTEQRHHRLVDVTKRLDVEDNIEHRALSDALKTYACYEKIKLYLADKGISFQSLYPSHKSYKHKPYNLHAKDIKTSNESFDEDSPIYGKIFVFTGTLEKMTRREAMQIVVDNGGLCGDGVTKKTNYLVLGNNDYCSSIKDGKSRKQKRAEELKLSGVDLDVISENVFYDMIKSN